MDELGLNALRTELLEDCRVVAEAACLARVRYGAGQPEQLEACAYQLARLYNAVEQLASRVARAFENHLEAESAWHMELVRRLSLEIPGVRPALWPRGLGTDLHELRAFRHVVRHAYDLTLQPYKLSPLIESAERVARALPGVCLAFCRAVAMHRDWNLAE
jgi:hypothetical protein